MRFLSLFGRTAAESIYILQLWLILTCVAPTQGLNFDPVPPPALDLSELGRVALTGDFDAISLYSYAQQTEGSYSTNGSQALITQRPNGDFATTVTSDGYIKAMCPFVMNDGTLAGIVVGGNFTSLGGQETQGVAMFDPSSQKVTPLPGLTGAVEDISGVTSRQTRSTLAETSRAATRQMRSLGSEWPAGQTYLLLDSMDLSTR